MEAAHRAALLAASCLRTPLDPRTRAPAALYERGPPPAAEQVPPGLGGGVCLPGRRAVRGAGGEREAPLAVVRRAGGRAGGLRLGDGLRRQPALERQASAPRLPREPKQPRAGKVFAPRGSDPRPQARRQADGAGADSWCRCSAWAAAISSRAC